MSELDEIRVFVTLVETQSSTKAAEKMGLAISAISRRMKELESRLGVQLIQRTTRRMTVTEEGNRFYLSCKRILEDLLEAENLVSDSAADLSGNIRIATPLSFGIGHLSSAIAIFMQLHPKVTIDIDMSDQWVDIVSEGFDLAIRIGKLQDSTLKARKLASMRNIVCCAPSLLAEFGPVTSPEELSGIPALVYSNLKNTTRWDYKDDNDMEGSIKVLPRMKSNNGDAMRDSAIAGLGVVCLPEFIVHQAINSGTLIPMLQEYQWFNSSIYAVYPPTRFLSARVRAFIDFLAERFGGTPYWQ